MPADQNTAAFNLKISSFVANAAPAPASGAPDGAYCGVSSLDFTRNGGSPDDANGQVTLSGTTIRVKRNNPGNRPIFITLNISCDDGNTYNPQNIVFVQKNNGAEDPRGNQNFTDRNPSNQSITFRNQHQHKGAGAVWKYYIQIKQMTGSQALGWIDPDVQNDA